MRLGVEEVAAAEVGGGETIVEEPAPVGETAVPPANVAGPCLAGLILLGLVGAPLVYGARRRATKTPTSPISGPATVTSASEMPCT